MLVIFVRINKDSRVKRLSIIGSGRLAGVLAPAFRAKGIQIVQVISRNPERAESLASRVGAGFSSRLVDLSPETDLILIAVTDSSIAEVSSQLPFCHIPVIHTAGSVASECLNRHSGYGVAYAPQSFSHNRLPALANTPFFIEASSEPLRKELITLFSLLSGRVLEANSSRRAVIHLAAVFANNFTNHLYSIADELLKSENLPLDLLFPIMQETLDKLKDLSPREAQTGPAIRQDEEVIKKQLEMLRDHPEYRKIYSFVSESIASQKKL